MPPTLPEVPTVAHRPRARPARTVLTTWRAPWRVAAYFAPAPEHPLWRAGCDWLGRDPISGTRSRPVDHRVVQPARYGFHATLKAPMRLREDATLDQLAACLADLADEWPCFTLPVLSVGWMGHFLALQLTEPLPPAHPLPTLAERCVRRLDRFRAPLSAQEWARRESAGLDSRSRELMRHWGYPLVFERWRFHMTLSDALPQATADEKHALMAAAQAHFKAALAEPLSCDAVSLCIEPHPGEPFQLIQRVPLALQR